MLQKQHITMSRSRHFMAEQRQILLVYGLELSSGRTVARPQQIAPMWITLA
jgi:hypothetical protein